MRICQKCGTIYKNSIKSLVCPISGCDGDVIKVNKSTVFLSEILSRKNYIARQINANMPHYSPDFVTSTINPRLEIALAKSIQVGKIFNTGCATVTFAAKPFLDDAGEEVTQKIGDIFYYVDNPSLVKDDKSLLTNIINRLCLNDMPLSEVNMVSVSLISINGASITKITIVFQNPFTYYSGIADLKLNKYHAFLNYDYLCKKAFLDVVQALPQIQ